MIDTLREIPSEYYHQSGQFGLLNVPFTILQRQFPYQQEVENLLKKFIAKVLHTYTLPIHAIELAKEYQHSHRFKVIYLYITRNQLCTSVPA